jgi:hypothetical protein
MASPYTKTMTSFSGADLIVTIGPQTIGELQSISWAIQREKAPVYTFGSPDPRSFSRGKRGIAGSLSFATFNRDALLIAIRDIWHEIAPKAMFSAKGNIMKQGSEDFTNAMDLAAWNATSESSQQNGGGFGFSGTTAVGNDTAPGSNDKYDPASGVWTPSASEINLPHGFGLIRGENILYADTIPPFDITMTFANEYGQAAFQKIYDVDILNEGSGVSVDTIVMERQMTYIARRISPIMEGVYTRDAGGQINAKPVISKP